MFVNSQENYQVNPDNCSGVHNLGGLDRLLKL